MVKKKLLTKLLILAALGLVVAGYSRAEGETVNNEELKKNAPSVFIDCRRCDRDYFRTEITFVNYVRDGLEADIHLLITEQRTGGGGQEYTMTFIGREKFAGIEHTLTYVSRSTDMRDEIRQGMVRIIERGLFPFIMKTPLAEYIFLDFRQELKPTAVEDKWNFWVFSISLDGELEAESQWSSRAIEANFSANRITPDMKIRLGISGEFDESKYDYEDETIISKSDEKNFSGLAVKSLSEHWSLGSWVQASSSTYSNLDSLFSFTPAIEYNFFPYSESTRRQLRFLYKAGWNRANYGEVTVYDKMSENLWNESLTITLEIREPWGSASTSLEGSHYFHDFQKNRLQLWGFLSFRIFRGFSVDVRGGYERIHDQLSLPKGEASLDEILLRRKELATEYEYSLSVGFRYTFGSVFSNVVNPRFGRTRRHF